MPTIEWGWFGERAPAGGTVGKRVVRILAVAVLACAWAIPSALPALADGPERPPEKLELRLVYIFEGNAPEYVFVIGDSGFKSVESLKAFLGTLPRGSEVRWAPGCERFGKEPLLSSEEDMAEFRCFSR